MWSNLCHCGIKCTVYLPSYVDQSLCFLLVRGEVLNMKILRVQWRLLVRSTLFPLPLPSLAGPEPLFCGSGKSKELLLDKLLSGIKSSSRLAPNIIKINKKFDSGNPICINIQCRNLPKRQMHTKHGSHLGFSPNYPQNLQKYQERGNDQKNGMKIRTYGILGNVCLTSFDHLVIFIRD